MKENLHLLGGRRRERQPETLRRRQEQRLRTRLRRTGRRCEPVRRSRKVFGTLFTPSGATIRKRPRPSVVQHALEPARGRSERQQWSLQDGAHHRSHGNFSLTVLFCDSQFCQPACAPCVEHGTVCRVGWEHHNARSSPRRGRRARDECR